MSTAALLLFATGYPAFAYVVSHVSVPALFALVAWLALLEAIYFACTGRSCRTANEREVVRFGAGVTRLELDAERDGESHRITVGFEPGEA